MRVVVLTSSGRTPPRVLAALRSRGITPDAVVVANHSALSECFRRPPGPARIAEFPVALARAVVRRLRPRFIAGFRAGRRLIVTGSPRSQQLRHLLERLAPDLLVLAWCGLIPPATIATARLGVVNAHPGLLPWLRNNGVVANAILKGVPVGATVHRVDAGIDTGPILRRRLVRVTRDARSLYELELAADITAAELLADVVAETVARGHLAPGQTQQQRFPLCRWLTMEQRGAVDRQVADGRAAALFEEWAGRADPVTLDLPGDLNLGSAAGESAEGSGPLDG